MAFSSSLICFAICSNISSIVVGSKPLPLPLPLPNKFCKNFGILIPLIPEIPIIATAISKNGNGFATGTEVGVGVFGGFLKPLITSNLERLLSSIEVSLSLIESSRKIGIRGIVFLNLLCSSFIFSTSFLNINPFLLSNFTKFSVFSLVTTSVSRIASISCVD